MGSSTLESAFDDYWQALGGPALDREVRFHPVRRWRFDRAHQAARVAVEVQGGVWNRGRHLRPGGYENDAAKLNAGLP